MSVIVTTDVETAVRARYSDAAQATEVSLCCPTTYDPTLLAAIPREVVERDYGCGNPAPHVRLGETVLDLGSGSGKACFIASQVAGSKGRVIGVDMNDDMLALARKHAPTVAGRIGYDNVEFKKGKIQDLALDLESLAAELRERPVSSVEDLARVEQLAVSQRHNAPMIADASVDVVISNCVLNLVEPQAKRQLFSEIFRVLRRGGRAVISDIVSDEDVPQRLQSDPELWSGCISGAFREDAFLEAFETAGFYGIALHEWQKEPWRTVEGIEFRSVTVIAYKGKEGPCLEHKQSVVYRGPFSRVFDDDGHELVRGVRTAVCGKTFEIYAREPYRSHMELIEPREPVSAEDAQPFAHSEATRRDPRQTKGADYDATTEAAGACATDEAAKGCC